ncbi:MAG TPA: PAS domain-containing sensor histidine kinase [Ignavibacteria bacterium]|nr:PAS domain-containing sensor histidine kinase [Ignavibacteria bacterium]
MLKDSDYKIIFNNYSAGLLLLDLESSIFQSNKWIESDLGFAKKELTGMKFCELLSDSGEKDFMNNLFHEMKELDNPLPILQIKLKTSAGSTILYDIKIIKIFLQSGSSTFYNCTLTHHAKNEPLQKQLADAGKKIYDIESLIQECYYEIDNEYKITYISDKIFELLGYTPAEVTGKQPYSLMKSTEAKKARFYYDEIFRQVKPFQGYKLEMLRKSGEAVGMETNGLPITDENGCITGIRAMLRSNDQKDENGQGIFVSRGRMEQLFSSSDNILRFILEGNNFFITSNVSKIFGYKEDTFFSLQNFLKKITQPGEYEEIFGKFFRWAKSNSNNLEFEFNAVTETGQIKRVSVFSIKPVPDSRKLFFVSTLFDLSSGFESQDFTKSSLKLLNLLPLDIEISDINGNVIFSKTKNTISSGFQNGNPKKGQNKFIDFVNHGVKEGISKTLKETGFYQGEVLTYDSSGIKRWNNLLVINIKNNQNKVTHYLKIKRDITDEIVYRNKNFTKDIKLSRKDKFIKEIFLNLVTDVLSPLNSIIGFGEILRNNLEGSDNEFLADGLLSESIKLFSDLKSILYLLKIDYQVAEEPYTNLFLSKEIKGIADHYRNIAGAKDVALDFKSNTKNDVVFANINLLNILLNCLLDTSLSFTNAGSIKLQIDSYRRKSKDYTLLSISDTGTGLPQETINMLSRKIDDEAFIPVNFNRVWLNLSIAKNICYILGGSLTIDNYPTEGTSYTIIFPNFAERKVR